MDELSLAIIGTNYKGRQIYEKLEDVLHNVNGLKLNNRLIQTFDISGLSKWESNNITYSNSSYLKRSDARNLRNDIVIQLATIENLQAYKDIEIISYRNDLKQTSGLNIIDTTYDEGLEIFIKNCKYRGSSYIEPQNVNELLSKINEELSVINGLEFAGIIVFSKHASKDNLTIGIDSAVYNGHRYLTLIYLNNLKDIILNNIASINNIDDSEIDIETHISKNFIVDKINGPITVAIDNVKWNNSNWLSDPQPAFNYIIESCGMIDKFDIGKMHILATTNSEYSKMTFFIGDSKYKKKRDLEYNDSVELKSHIKNVLGSGLIGKSMSYDNIVIY